MTPEQAREATGWELKIADDLEDHRAADRGGAEGRCGSWWPHERRLRLRRRARRRSAATAARWPSVRPDDLGAHVVRAIVERTGVDPERIDDVIFGNANGAGEDNRNVARMAALLAGLPTIGPRHDGQPAVRLEPRRRDAGQPRDRDRRRRRRARRRRGVDEPRAVGACSSPRRASRPARRRCTRRRSAGGWSTRRCRTSGRSRSARAPRSSPASHGIAREAQDAFALRSHQRAAPAWDDGLLRRWVVPVPDVELDARRGHPRRHARSRSSPSSSRRSCKDGTVTAGNSSPLNDGAVGRADRRARAPASRSRGSPAAARTRSTPTSSASGPVEAANKALKRAGISWGDVDLVELNEAFAAQSLACLGEWPDLDPEKVNVYGGAIAIGHPLGASGARILGHARPRAQAPRGGGWGVAAICIGVGQGLAVVIEA